MAKKIGAIVSLSIIGILILATIIMANINLNYGIDCVKPDSVYVQTKNDTVKVSSEQKDKIVEMISGASNEKFLTALFNGEADKKVEIRSEKSTISTPANYYVRYHYTSKQDFTGGLTVREWLSNFSYEEQYEYGLKFLEQICGVII